MAINYPVQMGSVGYVCPAMQPAQKTSAQNYVQTQTPYKVYPNFAYPQNYYISNPIPYATSVMPTIIQAQPKFYEPEFENTYNKYCTLNAIQKYVKTPEILNFDIDKEKSHFYNTYFYAKKLGEKLNLSANDMQLLKKAAIVHDIGKALVPSSIINKPDKLTVEERQIIDMHSPLGYELGKNMGFEQEVLDVMKNHHNNDKTNDILTEIIKMADRYDALTSVRPYKKAFSKEQALQILREEVLANKINASVYNAFLNCV